MAQFPSPALDVMPPPSHSSGIPRGDLEAFLHRLLTAPLGCLCTCPTGTDTCRRRVPIRDLPTFRDHHSTSSPWSPVTGHRGCSWPPAARLHQEPFAPTSCRTHTSRTQPPALPALGRLPCHAIKAQLLHEAGLTHGRQRQAAQSSSPLGLQGSRPAVPSRAPRTQHPLGLGTA